MNKIKLALIALATLGASASFAQTADTSINASATIPDYCSFPFSSLTANFGTILTGTGEKVISFNVPMFCSQGLPYGFYITPTSGTTSSGEAVNIIYFRSNGTTQLSGPGAYTGVGTGVTQIDLPVVAKARGSMTVNGIPFSFGEAGTFNINATMGVNF